jgi:hypothetical protein
MTWRLPLLILAFSLVAFAAAGCEKPDASDKTSPSVNALLGTTTGTVSYGASEVPPPLAKEPPTGWSFELGNARYSKLEDETPALQITLLLTSQAGTSMAAWLTAEDGTNIAQWKGGRTVTSEGTVCWFFRLSAGSESLQFGAGHQRFTLAFLDNAGQVVTSRTVPVNGFTPPLKGNPPNPGSTVFKDLLGCPRGS